MRADARPSGLPPLPRGARSPRRPPEGGSLALDARGFAFLVALTAARLSAPGAARCQPAGASQASRGALSPAGWHTPRKGASSSPTAHVRGLCRAPPDHTADAVCVGGLAASIFQMTVSGPALPLQSAPATQIAIALCGRHLSPPKYQPVH